MAAITKWFATGAVATLLIAIAAWLTVTYTGLYNVAAADAHADIVRWTLETGMRRSVARRADDVKLPARFSQELVAQGGRHYAESCAHCHGAPGKDPSGWSRGMRPEPPHLTEAATEWSAREVYWIVENGIKMSGMPAFASHRTPDEIAALTAFVKQMPGLTPEDYAAMTQGAGGHHHEGTGHE